MIFDKKGKSVNTMAMDMLNETNLASLLHTVSQEMRADRLADVERVGEENH